MVITDHLIIFLQQLTVRMCACIRTDRTCTHRTICTIMVTTQALLSCSSSNSSMSSTQRAPAPAQAAAARAREPLGQQHCSSCSSNLLASGAALNESRHRRIAYPREDLDEAVLHVQRSSLESNLMPNATSQQLVLLQQAASRRCSKSHGPNRPGI